MNETQSTFWQLIGDQSIVVPILQRDYAQGREDAHSSQVRMEFIAAIAVALKNTTATALDLGLIYGGENEHRLILIDGQQRLTTLFLLHWYAASRAGVGAASETRERLQRFTYEIRASARDFCRCLAENPHPESANASPAVTIEDSFWFFRFWKRDPTVAGMLVVIDEIHRQLEGVSDWHKLWNCLIEEKRSPLKFQVLRMEKLGLTDDIYIKMNSRGRALTEFETFKAWLEQKFDACLPRILNPADWSSALDMRWLDLFWRKRGDKLEIGDQFLRFLKNTALNHAMSEREWQATQPLIETITKETFLSKAGHEQLFMPENVNECFSLLEHLSKRWDWVELTLPPAFLFQKVPLLAIWKNGGTELTLPARVLFHGLSRYLLTVSEPNEVTFTRWMRVVRNLVLNSVIDRPEATMRAIKGISDLSNSVRSDLLEWLSASDRSHVGIDVYQLAEEKRKALLILKNPTWEALIVETENHEFSQGQIGFLLDMAVKDGNGPDIDAFRAYATLAKVIFNSEKQLVDSPCFLLERALLSITDQSERDYLAEVNSNYSFLKGVAEWKKFVFRVPDKFRILKRLFDVLLPGGSECDQVRTSLNKQIDAAKKEVRDWRRYFIAYPQAIAVCQQRKIRWEKDGMHILLLHGTTLKGWHAELRSYCLMEELNNKMKVSGSPQWEYCWRSGLEGTFPHTYLEQAGIRISISHPETPPDHNTPFAIEIDRDSEKIERSWHANEQDVLSTVKSLLTDSARPDDGGDHHTH